MSNDFSNDSSNNFKLNLEGVLNLSSVGFQDVVNLNYLANLYGISVPALKQTVKKLSSTGVIEYKTLQEYLDFPY